VIWASELGALYAHAVSVVILIAETIMQRR
jgi:hypothetical protein